MLWCKHHTKVNGSLAPLEMTGEGDKHVRHEVDHNVLFP